MQIRLSFSLILSTFILFAEAAPTRRNPGVVTLPLKSLHRPRDDIHPLVLHQYNINRGQLRYARMTGRAPPSAEQFESNLRKRVDAVLESTDDLAKRFNRGGVPRNAKRFNRYTPPGAGKRAVGGPDAVDAVNNGNLAVAVQPTAKNSFGLNIDGPDTGYVATLQLGTPARDFLVLMDSGSADFWVGGENCQALNASGNCGNHQFLGSKSSTSFKDTKAPWNIKYGTGSISGNIVSDNFRIGGLKLDGLTFGTALVESPEFSASSVPFDGLMGLARSDLSEQQTLTPIEAMKDKGLVGAAITSYKISRLSDQKNDGEITFGGLDQTKFDPKTLVELKNVNAKGFWEAPMGITVDGKAVPTLVGRSAILDTGTTLIIAPDADATAIHNAIPGSTADGQGGFTVPCNTNVSVALKFGTTSFSINTKDLAFLPLNNGTSNDCLSGIASGQVGAATQWLVGDVFLKNAYFSHNVDKNTVSLAKLV